MNKMLKVLPFIAFFFLSVSLICGCTSVRIVEVEKVVEKKVSIPSGSIRGRVLIDGQLMVSGIEIYNHDTGIRYREHTDLTGAFNIQLAPAHYTLEFDRGPEFSKYSVDVDIKSYSVNNLGNIILEQCTDLYSKGWVAGDLHMHTYYSDGSDSVENQLLGNLSKGLYFGFLTDHNSYEGIQEWTNDDGLVSYRGRNGEERLFHAFEGLEITTQFGHFQSLGAPTYFDTAVTNVEGSLKAKEKVVEYNEEISRRIESIASAIRNNGAMPQINHPFSSMDMGFNFWALGDLFDTIEIWNGVFVPGDGRYESSSPNNLEQNYESKLLWYELLNEVKNGGKFHAATCGTDNHDSSGKYRYKDIDVSSILNMEQYNEVYKRSGLDNGVPMIFVRCVDNEITLENVIRAVREGHSFLSNGITVLAYANGASYGDSAPIDDDMQLELDVFAYEGIERIQVIKNGQVYVELLFDAPVQRFSESLCLKEINAGDWVVIEVCGVDANYAITNPIFFGIKPEV